MLDKLSAIEARYNELNHLLEENANDYQKVAEFAKERSDLDAIIAKARLYRQTLQNIEEARALQDSDDAELRQMAVSELQELEPKVATLEKDLKSLMVPKDPRDDRNVIVEIRAGAGGDEAALFAAELMRMYSHYAERKGWKVEILSENAIGIGGYKEVIFTVKGKGAY